MSAMRLLIVGARGQVGYRLLELAGKQGIHADGLERGQCDFSTLDEAGAARLLDHYKPTHVVNAAGYTAVDAAEREPELATQVNAHAPALLAHAAATRSLPFVHFSTDYVFDGARGAPYAESAVTNPLNVYGLSKLRGERAVMDAHGGAYVFRLQWVFDARGNNFLRSMVKLLAERTSIGVVADQVGAPSNAADIAELVLKVLQQGGEPGLYHCSPAGHTSWHGFACEIARHAGSTCALTPITAKEYPTAATRPQDARLDSSKLAQAGLRMPDWRQGVARAMEELRAAH